MSTYRIYIFFRQEIGPYCLYRERDWCEKFWPGLVENDLTSLEMVVRRVAEGKGKAIPILALDVVWAAAKTEDPTVGGQTKDKRGRWSVPFR